MGIRRSPPDKKSPLDINMGVYYAGKERRGRVAVSVRKLQDTWGEGAMTGQINYGREIALPRPNSREVQGERSGRG